MTRRLTPYVPSLREAVRDAASAWLALPVARWRDLEPAPGVGRVEVTVQEGGQALRLVLRDAAGGEPWTADGIAITCHRPARLEPSHAGWLRHLAERFAAASPPSAGELRRALAQSRRFEAEGIDDTDLVRLEQSTHGLRGFLRLGFRCNQRCPMCPQGRHWPDAPKAQVFRWLDELADRGVVHLTLSGGEPTTYPWLEELVERAATFGMEMLMQTNAVLLAKVGRAERLREAGLSHVFVSLHSADPAISDRMTNAPGTHPKTLEGIERCLDAGLWVGVNCCVERPNAPGLPDHARLVVDRFVHRQGGEVGHVEYSQPGAYYLADHQPTVMAPLDEVATPLREALAILAAAGVATDCTGTCGFPPCLLRDAPRLMSWRRRGRLDAQDLSARTYLPACDGCAARPLCVGVRREVAEAFGDRGLRPFATLPDGAEEVEDVIPQAQSQRRAT